MSDYLLMVVAATVVVIAVVLLWLLRELKLLRREYRLLAEQLQSSKEDVAGLCAAAVVVDQHLSAHDAQLEGLITSVPAQQPAEPVVAQVAKSVEEPQEYDRAIQKIRRGAGVDELVKECGLTRDEAVLLIRLHGGRR